MSWGMNQNETAFAPIRQQLFRNRETLALAVNLIWQECTMVHDGALWCTTQEPVVQSKLQQNSILLQNWPWNEMCRLQCNKQTQFNAGDQFIKNLHSRFQISNYLTHPSQTHLRGKRLAGQVLYFVSFWKHYLGSLLEPSFRGVRAALAFLRKATTGGWHCVEVAEEAEEGKLWCNSDSKLSVPAGLPGSHLQLASTTGAWRVSRLPPDSCADLKSWNSLQREVKDPICDCWEVSRAKYLQGYCALLWNFSGK